MGQIHISQNVFLVRSSLGTDISEPTKMVWHPWGLIWWVNKGWV